jgi:hypothetical protein
VPRFAPTGRLTDHECGSVHMATPWGASFLDILTAIYEIP